METLLQDLRHAARSLRKSPGFSAVVVLTLALGIGANSAIFSVVNALLFRPLPYEEPERLVTINHYYPSLNGLEASVSARGFRDYRDRTRSFEAVAVGTGWQPNLTGAGEPERLLGARVSAQYFEAYRAQAALGRTPLPEEDEPGRNFVVVLSDGLWRRLFGADPGVVGRSMMLDGRAYEIVGVLPPGFRDFFVRRAELWTPLALTAEQYAAGPTNEWLALTARLRPGVGVETAQAEMRQFAEQLKQNDPDSYPEDWSLLVTALDEEARGDLRPVLLVLLGAVGFVLLIACVNVANLQIARGVTRLKEVAIRTAMGARRRHVVRQLLTESMLLALAGGALGLLIALWSVHALSGLIPTDLPGVENIGIDGAVLLFTLSASIAAGLLFGVAPAVHASEPDVQDALREGGRTGTGDRSGRLLRRSLVVAELALALTLLAGAGLLIRSFARLKGVDPGFGAAAGDVLRLVLRQGMALAAAGVALGLLGALALTRLMTSQLYAVRPTDPLTFVSVAGVLAAVAFAATVIPARRAARVPPAEALHYE